MCEVQKEKLISCQLSFYPLGKEEYISDINQVLEIIHNSNLEYTINDMATIIKGTTSLVFKLLQSISETTTCNFTMNVVLSNTCGCAI